MGWSDSNCDTMGPLLCLIGDPRGLPLGALGVGVVPGLSGINREPLTGDGEGISSDPSRRLLIAVDPVICSGGSSGCRAANSAVVSLTKRG